MASETRQWQHRTLLALFLASLVTQNAIALPYVRKNGPGSVADFFVGDFTKTTPGKFAMADLGLTTLSFHTWALFESRRLGILRWWLASFLLTFTVGIATAVPFFLLARERAVAH